MRDLVVLKVKIGLKNNGQALYPSFNSMDCVNGSGMDWSKYVDIEGLGWHYDNSSGHKEGTPDSPYGQQWGVLIVAEEFVNEAVIRFPDTCAKLTEIEVEDFYNNKVAIDQPDEDIDVDIVQGIKLKQDLGLTLTAGQQKAIDPDDDTRGIRKNKEKVWADYKKLKDIAIK